MRKSEEKSGNKGNMIFLHKLFKAFADSIINIFIPLYILKMTGSLTLALGYLCVYSFLVTILNIFLSKFIQKFGVIAIILHFLPIIAAETILNFCPLTFLALLFVALFMALSQVLYSVPFNLVFLYGDSRSNVAKFQIATNFGKLVFILISGYILSSEIQNSFLWLMIASSVFYIASVIPIGFSFKVIKQRFELSTKVVKPKEKCDFKFSLYHITFGMFQATIDNCLPLFLYAFGLSFQAVTIQLALVALCKILANFVAKILIGKRKQIVCFVINFLILSISMICVMIVKNPTILYILSCLCSVAFPFTFVPMFKLFCEDIREKCSAFGDMTRRDVDIFSLRPVVYGSSIIGLGMYPCFVLGILATTVMFACEVKLDKKQKITEKLEEESSENQLENIAGATVEKVQS